MTKKEVELSSIEATAYWWINVIKNKVRELVVHKTSNKQEIAFVQKFYNYTEVDWRNLYLELVKYITEDVNNYVKTGDTIGIDAFSQDTEKKGHDRINAELSKIMHCSIPDIRLASSSSKDSVIYTNMFGACVWYKSCGVTDLPTKYDMDYILTGDEQELNFYKLVILTIAVLKEKDSSFNSVSLLRTGFCDEYRKVNNFEENLNEFIDKFNQVFIKGRDKGIIFGSPWNETYFPSFRDIDLVGLEKYMNDAEHYANVILKKTRNNKTSYTKKLN